MDKNQIGLDILDKVTQNDAFLDPEEYDWDLRMYLNRTIKETYEEHVKKWRQLPSIEDIYSVIWMRNWGDIYHITAEVVDEHARKQLSLDDQIHFFDMEYKDLVNEMCYDVSKFLEDDGYREKMRTYIKHFITGLGYSIYIVNPELSEIKVIAGDAQIRFQFENYPGYYMVVGKNMLAEIETGRGGVLLG